MKLTYEESLFYQISSAAKYFEILFKDIFKELDLGIEGYEHLALSVIYQTKDCCQRDLAKVILKDRANTGKLAQKLQAKGLIKIETKEKNNKPVKILTLTDEGEKLYNKVNEKIQPMADKIRSEMTYEKIDTMLKNIAEFKQIVKNAVKINI